MTVLGQGVEKLVTRVKGFLRVTLTLGSSRDGSSLRAKWRKLKEPYQALGIALSMISDMGHVLKIIFN